VATRLWLFARCQSPDYPLLQQLKSGIRAFDIRLSAIDGRLVAYHGIISQHVPFSDILDVIYAFLRSKEGCRECVVMSVKQENFAEVPWDIFSDLMRQQVYHHGEANQYTGIEKSSFKNSAEHRSSRDMWWLQNRVPTLGEARGKIVLFSRFGGDGRGWDGGLEGLGIHPASWPDSRKEGFEWGCGETTIRTHDWLAQI
jgi:1-phosphatidylinositol phosphodiesterase